MKKSLFLIMSCLMLSATSAWADSANITSSHFRIGKTDYSTDLYPSDSNTYLFLDKSGDNSDASLVLRDQGNVRAEIGLVEDNDIHIKTVTGKYGSEVFTDRLLIRAKGGEVDSFGTVLRQYATSGKPTIVAGDSDLSEGAGLELAYDHDEEQSEITSVDHGDTYRPLIINSNGVDFYEGTEDVTKVASLSDKGLMTVPATVSGGTPFTVSGCKAGKTVGGAAAGTFKSGMTGTCTAVITINGATGLAAPHGWACSGNNLTDPVKAVHQTASTAATATLTGATAAGDVISFYCMGY
jgi:hypothetical protein